MPLHGSTAPAVADVRPAVLRNPSGWRARRARDKQRSSTTMKALHNLLVREEGQDLVEYALLAALLSIVSIVALQALGPVIANVWTRIQAAIESV